MYNNHSNLRNHSDFMVPFATNNYLGIESISHLGHGTLFLSSQNKNQPLTHLAKSIGK